MKFSFNKNFDIKLSRRVHIYITFVIGLIVFLFSVYLVTDKVKFLNSSDKIPATVIDFETHSENNSHKENIMYKAVFLYENKNGNQENYISNVSSNPPSFEIGEETYLYVSSDGKEIIEDSFFALYGFEFILFVIGLVFLCISYCINNISSKKERVLSRNLVFNKNNAFNANKLARGSDPFLLDISGEEYYDCSRKNIEIAISKVIKGDEDFVILTKGNQFIQYAGHTVEHRINDAIFQETDKTDFTKEEVLELFLLFLKDPGKISEKYEWSDSAM